MSDSHNLLYRYRRLQIGNCERQNRIPKLLTPRIRKILNLSRRHKLRQYTMTYISEIETQD